METLVSFREEGLLFFLDKQRKSSVIVQIEKDRGRKVDRYDRYDYYYNSCLFGFAAAIFYLGSFSFFFVFFVFRFRFFFVLLPRCIVVVYLYSEK